jgi:MFS family permease
MLWVMPDNKKKTLRDSTFMRWAVLVLASSVMFMNYYFYDAPNTLKDLLEKQLGWSSTDYGFFNSAYSVPNVFLLMAVLGGIILDKWGIRKTGFLFTALMALGGLVTAYGATAYFNDGGFGYGLASMGPWGPSLVCMSFGFFLFGLGAETSIVVLSKIVVKWFKGKEMALALGLNLAIGRLGSALAMNLTPKLTEPTWNFGIWVGAGLMILGFFLYLAYMGIDFKLDKQLNEAMDMDPEEEFRLAHLKELVTDKSVLYITALCVTFYSAIFPFLKYAPDLLMNKFGMERAIAGEVSSYLVFGTIALTPLFGWVTDTKGKTATLMYIGSALLIVSHGLFALTSVSPYVPLFTLGVAFSLVPAAMWPAVAKIVKDSRLGTAYGFMFSVQNLGLFAFPILIGKVLDASNPGVAAAKKAGEQAVYDYTNPMLVFAACGVAGLIFAFLLKREDKVSGYGLEQPNKQD